MRPIWRQTVLQRNRTGTWRLRLRELRDDLGGRDRVKLGDVLGGRD